MMRRRQTKKGDFFYDLTLDDLEGSLSVFIPSEVYRRYRDELRGHGPFIVEGIVDKETNPSEPVIIAQTIRAANE